MLPAFDIPALPGVHCPLLKPGFKILNAAFLLFSNAPATSIGKKLQLPGRLKRGGYLIKNLTDGFPFVPVSAFNYDEYFHRY
jgi:hypothetical protein